MTKAPKKLGRGLSALMAEITPPPEPKKTKPKPKKAAAKKPVAKKPVAKKG